MVTDKTAELMLGAGPTTGNMMTSSVYTRSLTGKNTAPVPASDYNVSQHNTSQALCRSQLQDLQWLSLVLVHEAVHEH